MYGYEMQIDSFTITFSFTKKTWLKCTSSNDFIRAQWLGRSDLVFLHPCFVLPRPPKNSSGDYIKFMTPENTSAG